MERITARSPASTRTLLGTSRCSTSRRRTATSRVSLAASPTALTAMSCLWPSSAFGQGPPLHLEHIWRDGFDYHLTVTTTSLGTTISTIPAMADYDDNAQVPKKPTSGASIIL